jgi:hypothetical protein
MSQFFRGAFLGHQSPNHKRWWVRDAYGGGFDRCRPKKGTKCEFWILPDKNYPTKTSNFLRRHALVDQSRIYKPLTIYFW